MVAGDAQRSSLLRRPFVSLRPRNRLAPAAAMAAFRAAGLKYAASPAQGAGRRCRRRSSSRCRDANGRGRATTPCAVAPLASYLQYSLIAARALRSVLKEEAKAAALRREGTSAVKFSKWEAGKQQAASTCAPPPFPIRSAMAGANVLSAPGIAHAGATYCGSEPLEAAN